MQPPEGGVSLSVIGREGKNFPIDLQFPARGTPIIPVLPKVVFAEPGGSVMGRQRLREEIG